MRATAQDRMMFFARLMVTSLVALVFIWPAKGAEAKKAAPPPVPRFAFVALGCMPYTADNYAAYERLLAEISRHRPAFTVHCGDVPGNALPVLPPKQ